MQYAIVDGRRAEAFAGGHGTCETCGSTMVAKCGPRVLHHWAHASRRNCDPWWENETPWHRAWKNLFPEDCREICHVAPDGEIHRADIKTSTGIVIEVQHSAMTNAERLSREDFYGNLVWVLDGSAFRDNFQVHHILPDPTSELAKDLVWLRAGVGLHRANRGIFLRLSECQQDDPTVTKATAYGGCMRSLREIEKEVANAYRGHHQYVWVRPRRTWLEATCPVYIDFGEDWLARLETYDESGIPCLLRVAKRKFLHDAMFETNARAIATRYYPINGPPRALGRNETASAMTETPPARLEHEIFADLQALCTQPGFIHVLAYLCFRDNMVLYSEDVTVEHLREVFGPDRLIRTEITTLLGLMIKAPIDWTLPPRELQQRYLEASEHLLLELHHALNAALNLSEAAAAIERGEEFNPFEAGPAMREPMFYAAESAYDFQYLDLASLRYAADADWLQQHRGFTIEQASRVAEAANRLYQGRFDALREQMREAPPDQWTMLPGFSFTAAEVAAQAELDDGLVEHILDAFTLPADEVNTGFATVHDFNAVTATPLLRRPNGEYVSLQNYALAQAIYDSPFHWMLTDKAYRATQDKHRGDFTESFVAERLATVFGADRVLLNVDIWEGKGKKVGEIDVLVLWADRAIIVQAKSKKLTIEARKGNDQVIRDDFQKSVQDAYDQGLLCAECLGDPQFRVTRTNGAEVELDGSITEIFVFCVVSDHYPALNFQARQFLKTREVARVRSALVTDVFLIDALTELLNSPLRFLSYVSRRARYGDRLLASQEMAILGYHLKHNLWFDDEKALVTLDNEFALPIDLAMAVRRRGLAGAATPEGLLTRYEGTTIGRLLDEMAAHAQPAVLDQGFQLLEMDGETLDSLNRMIDGQAKRAARDGQPHNIALVFPDRSGFTVLISAEPDEVAMRNLALLAARRKYLQKADLWFGLCLTPGDAQLRFGLRLAWPWEQNDELDAAAAKEVLPKPMPHRDAVGRVFRGGRTTPRVGRNDPCPCGSGRKWKKCCGA